MLTGKGIKSFSEAKTVMPQKLDQLYNGNHHIRVRKAGSQHLRACVFFFFFA